MEKNKKQKIKFSSSTEKENPNTKNNKFTENKTPEKTRLNKSKIQKTKFTEVDRQDSKHNPMHRERSRTKEILKKFQAKDKEDGNKNKAKAEVYMDKKGKQKIVEIKEKIKEKKDEEERLKKEELENLPQRVVVQFTSAEGKNLGGTLSIETNSNKELINSVINKLKKDEYRANHLLMVEDTEIN